MNKTILNKCIESLKSEKPDLSYVRGMLETLYEIESPTKEIALTPIPMPSIPMPLKVEQEKEEYDPLVDAYARGPIGNITS